MSEFFNSTPIFLKKLQHKKQTSTVTSDKYEKFSYLTLVTAHKNAALVSTK